MKNSHLNLVWSVACMGAIAASVMLFAERFSFAVPAQDVSCLKARYFLVEKSAPTLNRERLIAFTMPVETQYFHKGTRWIKKLVGVPGDHIKVSREGVAVNDRYYANDMNQLLMAMKLPNGDEFYREFDLSEGQYFMIGETPLSYDSRFWGPISTDDMTGNAYAIF